MARMRAKEMVFNIIKNYQQLYAEHELLKQLLSTYPDQRIRQHWKQALQDLLENPDQEAMREFSAKFDALYAQVSDAIDHETGLGLLLGLPPKGPLV